MVRTEDACEIIKYALQNEIKVLLNYKVLKIYSYDNSLKSGHQNVKSIVCKVQLQTIGFFHYCVTSKFTIKK